MKSLVVALMILGSSAFVPLSFQDSGSRRDSSLWLSSRSERPRRQSPKAKKGYTIKDLRDDLIKNPPPMGGTGTSKKSKYRRVRRRVENPKQTYMYAAQRRKNATEPEAISESTAVLVAKEFGLSNPAAQHCEPLVDYVEPEILGQIRVSDDDEAKSGSYAYIINKPAGWSILGGKSSSNKARNEQVEPDRSEAKTMGKHKHTGKISVAHDDSSRDILEYSELDVRALMTPEELEQYENEMEDIVEEPTLPYQVTTSKNENDPIERIRIDNDDGTVEEFEFNILDMFDLMTPEELAGYENEEGPLPEVVRNRLGTSNSSQLLGAPGETLSQTQVGGIELQTETEAEMNAKTIEVLSKIEARKASTKKRKASFGQYSRPSVVAWLKDLKTQEGSPMRGGKYWTGLAGAVDVDDSGIVIVCPKGSVESLFVDYLEYIAVVGNNGVAPKPNLADPPLPKDAVSMEIISKVRRSRGDDVAQTVKIMVSERFSKCSSLVQPCQEQFQDGIRGDPAGNPFDRRANRRLLHCNAVSVSSLVCDETVEVETDSSGIPDDIAILADRRNHHGFKQGSFLGRAGLKANPLTTAYREINGAADGFPGWVVDRYDRWLFVQHDEKYPRGPLPSIHDQNTLGVYYLSANPDRSAMGASVAAPGRLTRPQLLEGQAAPDQLSILENGVTYLVSLDKDLSTGIFLDQRPQRAWLTQNCNNSTHVLNCFAHCGGFSIAAASAGALTTSVDLSQKWLERVEEQLEANGIPFDHRHDCIYGDCFDWLAKLAKRGEKYDIVILDPPSTSVGGKKKKRWSIKQDMPQLVALASQVVKKGGLLWTTTNSASVSHLSFARLCRKGLGDADKENAKLERIAPMPHDFPSVGPQPVKNFVWRMP